MSSKIGDAKEYFSTTRKMGPCSGTFAWKYLRSFGAGDEGNALLVEVGLLLAVGEGKAGRE